MSTRFLKVTFKMVPPKKKISKKQKISRVLCNAQVLKDSCTHLAVQHPSLLQDLQGRLEICHGLLKELPIGLGDAHVHQDVGTQT